MSSRETSSNRMDGLLEQLQQEDESEENGDQEPTGVSSSNSSVGSREFQANNVTSIQAVDPLSLQGQQGVFHSGSTASGPGEYSQQAVGTQLPNPASAATSGRLILPVPIIVESSQQGIQSLNPQQHMSFSYYQNQPIPSQNGHVPSNQNRTLILANDQQIVPPSLIAHQAGQSPPSNIPIMGMDNQGYIFPENEAMQNFGNARGAIGIPYHLPVSNLPSEFRLETSSRIQLPQIQQHDPPQMTLPNIGDGGYRTQQRRPPPIETTIRGPPTSATGSQEIQFQRLMNQAAAGGPRNFHPGAGSSSSHVEIPNMPNIPPEIFVPYIGSGSSLPLSASEGLSPNMNNNMRGSQGNFVHFSQFEPEGSSMRSPKTQRRMPNEGDKNVPPSTGLHLGNWFSQGQNYPNHPTINTPQGPK